MQKQDRWCGASRRKLRCRADRESCSHRARARPRAGRQLGFVKLFGARLARVSGAPKIGGGLVGWGGGEPPRNGLVQGCYPCGTTSKSGCIWNWPTRLVLPLLRGGGGRRAGGSTIKHSVRGPPPARLPLQDVENAAALPDQRLDCRAVVHVRRDLAVPGQSLLVADAAQGHCREGATQRRKVLVGEYLPQRLDRARIADESDRRRDRGQRGQVRRIEQHALQ